MNWIEIGGYFLNLDNIAFVTDFGDIKTQIGFIGGQSMNLDLPKEEVVAAIIKHHKDRNIV